MNRHLCHSRSPVIDSVFVVLFLTFRNELLWLHTVFAFLYLLMTVYSMRRHTSKMHYKEDDLVSVLQCIKKQLQLRSIVLMPHNISRLMGSAVNLNLFYDGNDLPFRDVSSLNPFTGEANFVHQRDCEVCRREPNQATFRVRFFSLLKTLVWWRHFIHHKTSDVSFLFSLDVIVK